MAGAAARRRPLALLAHIAASGDAGISRELALARFWPDSDETKARNNLKQAVFGLRRDLGNVFADSAATLRVDRTVIAVDALDFLESVQRDDLAGAVELYRGPFLEGFSIPDLDEFERWVEEQRQRFGNACHRALESMAEQARRAGDLAAAVEAWRKRAAMDPLSGRATAGFMRALRDIGDHTAALDLLRVHEVLVRDELGAAPDPALVALAAEIRRGFSIPPSSSPRPRPPAPTPPAPTAAIEPAAATPPSLAAVAAPAPTTAPEPARTAAQPGREGMAAAFRAFWARRVVPRAPGLASPRDVLMYAIALFAPILTWRLAARPLAEAQAIGVPSAVAPSVVAVLPFAVRGDADDPIRLGAGVADLVAVALNGADRFRTVPPSVLMPRLRDDWRDGVLPKRAQSVASDAGASEYVTGEVVRDGRRLHVLAALHTTATPGIVIASAAADGAADEIGETAERLVTALLAQRLNGPGDGLARAATGSTTSLPALKAWLGAERDYDDQRYGDAVAGFSRAVTLDSSFALAYYRLANAYDAQGDGPHAMAAVAQAVRYGERLPTSIRELVTAWRDWRDGDIDAAEHRFEAIAEEQPNDVEAWLRLGELRFRDNPTRGQSARGARSAFERVVAIQPDNTEALLYLARIASLERRMPEAQELAQRARGTAIDTRLVGLRAVRTFAIGDGVEPEDAVRARVTGVADGTAIDIAVHRDDVAAMTTFTRALLATATSTESRELGFRLAGLIAATRARWTAAAAALDSVTAADRWEGVPLRAILSAQPFFRVDPDDLRQVAATLAAGAPRDRDPRPWQHALGVVAAARGDDATLARQIAVLRAAGARGDRLATALAASLSARASERADRLPAALAALDSTRLLAIDAQFGVAAAADRYLRAEILHRLGRDDEASSWYASMAERASFELPWLAPSELRLAEIRAKRGDAGSARQHYLRFLTLWQECDPALREATAGAARALASLGNAG